jgi:hypothetical protein
MYDDVRVRFCSTMSGTNEIRKERVESLSEIVLSVPGVCPFRRQRDESPVRRPPGLVPQLGVFSALFESLDDLP